MIFNQTSAVVIPNVSGASGYLPKDVIGNEFEIPYACGNYGGLVEQLIVVDLGSANADMRLHLFNQEPSAYSPSGIPFALAVSDVNKYIGHVDVTGWVSAGGAKMIGVVPSPGIGVYAPSTNRNIWGVMEALGNMTAGNVANSMTVSMLNRIDS